MITVIAPPRYSHAAALREVAETVFYGLRELGHEATIEAAPVPRVPPGARSIVLGAHLLPEFVPLLNNATIYNLEQIEARESPFATLDYVDRLRAHEVWDYDQSNVLALAKLGIKAHLVPIGYVPQLERIVTQPQDIDVLFYGSINERRAKIIADLESRGVQVVARFDDYGATRDELIARAKIVLNVHFYPTQIFEIVRVSYLLTNRKCVVSEGPVERDFMESVTFTSYDHLADTCCELLADAPGRAQLADRGVEIMRQRPEVEYLRSVLSSPAR